MESAAKILVVDDDDRTVRLLTRYLSKSGYTVDAATDGEEMYRSIRKSQPDLVLLDLELPGKHGLELARELRSESADIGIIIVTGTGADIDMIVSLETGADDYIEKPFNERALLARVRSVLRRIVRRNAQSEKHHIAKFAGYTLDMTAHKLVDSLNKEIHLTSYEYRLLELLVTHANRVLSRDQILDALHERAWDPTDRSVDVLVNKLRKKLELDTANPQIIKTMRGFGYIMTSRVDFSD